MVLKTLSIASLVFLSVAGAAGAAERLLPDEVAAFIDRRETCDLFRGERPHDADRRRFVRDALDSLCTGTDRELKRLREKYRGDPHIIGKLKEYEANIEVDR